MITLGTMVRDKLTGFEGIAVSHTTWLYGCSRVGIQSKKLHDGKPVEVQWFDEVSVEAVAPTEPVSGPKMSTGGPRNDPTPRRSGE